MHDRLEIGNEIGQTRLQSEHEGTGQPDPVESGSHAQRHEDDADQRCTTIRGHAKVALDNEIISDSCRAGRHVSIEPKTGLAGMGATQSGHSEHRLRPVQDVLRDRNDLKRLTGCADFIPNSFAHQKPCHG